jgi:hypothetical protein
MLIRCFLSLIICCVPLVLHAEPEWVLAGGKNDGSYKIYIRSDIQRLSNDLVEGWDLSDFKERQTDADLKITYRSIVGRRFFNCKESSAASISLAFYPDSMGKGPVIRSMRRSPEEVRYVNIGPNGPGRFMFDKVCSWAFIAEVQGFLVLQSSRFAEIFKRLDNIDLKRVVAPEALTSVEGIAGGRDTIISYRALLAQRGALLKSHVAESTRLINMRSPTEDDKRAALAAMDTFKSVTIKTYDDLDVVQNAVINAMSEILDWAATQQGKLVAKDSRLVFSNALQQTKMQVLAARLETAEAKQKQVLRTLAELQQKYQTSMGEYDEKLQQLRR